MRWFESGTDDQYGRSSRNGLTAVLKTAAPSGWGFDSSAARHHRAARGCTAGAALVQSLGKLFAAIFLQHVDCRGVEQPGSSLGS
jgi:hypothetical protein